MMTVVIHTSRSRFELQESGEWHVYDHNQLANLPKDMSKDDAPYYLFNANQASHALSNSTDATIIALRNHRTV